MKDKSKVEERASPNFCHKGIDLYFLRYKMLLAFGKIF
jgi:hypothetical protein